MKIWVDDIRPAPDGYRWCKSVNETIRLINSSEAGVNRCMDNGHKCFLDHDYPGRTACYQHAEDWEIEVIDLDHDAGDYAADGGDFIKVLDWLEATGRDSYPIRLHTMNHVGRQNVISTPD